MKASYSIEHHFNCNDYVCYFKIDNRPNFDERGTDGTGLKIYATKEKAENAGKRYIKKMKKNGFEV